MESITFMFLIIRLALLSYTGVSRKDAIDIQKEKSYEELESQLKVEDWATYIVKMLNKYVLKENILSTDFRAKKDWKIYDKASDRYYENFRSNSDDFYFALIDAIKEFHDTKVYNNKLNINEDSRSYRPISTKKFDDLTYDEFLRDVCLFDAIIQEYHWLYGGLGKYNDNPYGTFKGNVQIENAFKAYKNGTKELSLEQIIEKYQHMDRFAAEKIGIYVKAPIFEDTVDKHTTETLFENSKSMYFPATIGGKPLAILKGGLMVEDVEKVYLLGDVERIEPGFLENCNIKEVIALGKIDYISGSALNGYKSTPENGIMYIKVNGNPHYFAANIRDNSLNHIKLPNDTKEICDGFISLCPLETIDLGTIIKIHDGAFSGADCLKEIILPDTLEELGAYAFKQSAISKLSIGKKLKVIENCTFQQCDNLKEVYIPENIILIKKDAFTYSENLKVAKVHVNTIIEEDAFNKQVKIERYGTLNKEAHKIVVEEVKEDNDTSLFSDKQENKIKQSTNTFKDYAASLISDLEKEIFNENDNLVESGNNELKDENHSISDNLENKENNDEESIEDLFNDFMDALKKLSKVEKDSLSDQISDLKYAGLKIDSNGVISEIKYNSDIKRLVINDTYDGIKVTKIENIFKGTEDNPSALQEVIIDTDAQIDNSFWYCPELTSVIFKGKINLRPSTCFICCDNMKNIIDGCTYTKINDTDDFILQKVNYGTKNVNVSSNCEIIANHAFLFSKINSIIFGKNVKKINEFAFASSWELNTVILNEGLEFIEQYAFEGCKKLMEIEIPSSVKYIGSFAFDCSNLNKVVLSKTTKYEVDTFPSHTKIIYR